MGGRRGVPLSVPLPFLLTAACMAALFGILLPWIVPEALQAPGFPHVLALVHTATLGWLTMAIMGASLQLTPVIVVSPLRAARFIRGLYPMYAVGVLLLLAGFWWFLPWLLALGGSLVVLSVIHYAIILGVTLARATTRPLTLRYLAASLVYLCIVVSLGLTAALDFQFGFLGNAFNRLLLTHITLGVVGWLTSVLIGVSYTLVRLFSLAHGHNDRLGRVLFPILNAGIVALSLGFIFSWLPLTLLGGVALVATAWLFAYDYARMLMTRRRKLLDVTQYHGIAAVVYVCLVIPLGIIAAIFSQGQAALLFTLGLLTLVGWLGQSITGYLYKIVPFLVWHTHYGPLVGHQKVPLMRDLVHDRWSWLTWWLLNISLPLIALCALAGWLIPLQIACAILGLGLLLAAINVVGIVRHLYRPST